MNETWHIKNLYKRGIIFFPSIQMRDESTKEMKENVTDEEKREIILIDEELLRSKIYEVRGQKVMLDFELAEIYGYATKRFNERVKKI